MKNQLVWTLIIIIITRTIQQQPGDPIALEFTYNNALKGHP